MIDRRSYTHNLSSCEIFSGFNFTIEALKRNIRENLSRIGGEKVGKMYSDIGKEKYSRLLQ